VALASVVEAAMSLSWLSMSWLPRSGSHRLSRAAAVLLVCCIPVAATTPAAHATPTIPLLSCQGQFTVTYDPPLTNTPTLTRVTFHNDLHYCLVGGVTSGDVAGEFTAIRSCTTVDLPPHPATNTSRWNTGASSTIVFSHSTVDSLVTGTTVVDSYGTVTEGFDEGANAVHTAIQPQLDLTACAGNGVAHVTGPETLVFIN
jgi:hypothetical protein